MSKPIRPGRKGARDRHPSPARAGSKPSPTAAGGSGGATRWTRWFAYALIAVFAVYWATQAFTFHRMGNYGVETDFYWKYGPAARGLTHGAIEIQHYDSKGWGYPATVAVVSLLGFEMFRAGQIVALLSALLALWLLYRLHRSLFDPGVALAGLVLVAGNATFLMNTYEVGTDMFFLAMVLASIALLLRSGTPGWRAIAASGLLGGWAFSTRYNGLFLLPGVLALFMLVRVPPGPMRVQWRRSGLWVAGFVLGALPWLWINAAHTGNPLSNSNYVNVGYAVYGEGNWEKFFYGGGRKINSFLDVVMLDPGRFAGAMAKNVVEHVRRDLFELLSPPWGVLAMIGTLLLVTGDRPNRRVVGYLIFGALGFLSLVPVFYGTRFSLPLLPFYAALATWPLLSPRLTALFGGLERAFPARAFVYLLIAAPVAFAAIAWTDDADNPEALRAAPYELSPAIQFLGENARAGSDALIARKPHAAFMANLRFVPIPEVANLDSLRAVAGRERARLLLVSGTEIRFRPALRPLAEPVVEIPGYRRIFESPGALVYEVTPPTP